MRLLKRNPDKEIVSAPVMTAIVIAALSLVLSAGVARWTWLLMEEQISLRYDFENLKMAQEEINVQYEFWLEQLETERGKLKE